MKTKCAILFFLILTLVSCATMQSWFKPIAKYNQRSYENFTALQANLKVLIDTLSSETSQDRIDSFYLMFDVIYEYERGKGLENHETIAQLELLKKRIDTFVDEALTEDLTIDYREAKKETLARILDVIISTEYAKPK